METKYMSFSVTIYVQFHNMKIFCIRLNIYARQVLQYKVNLFGGDKKWLHNNLHIIVRSYRAIEYWLNIVA
jgi:hypothetical protein